MKVVKVRKGDSVIKNRERDKWTGIPVNPKKQGNLGNENLFKGM